MGILLKILANYQKKSVECIVHEFLSSEKKSLSKSSEAKRSSFKLSFFPIAVEFVSVSSRAITTTGTGATVFAVLGLKINVLIVSKDFGADPEAIRTSFHVAAELVSACKMVAVGLIERLLSF